MDKSIEHFIESFNIGWTQGKFEALESLLHENVVFVSPDLLTEIAGRETCLQTIKDYSKNADTDLFKVVNKKIHVWNRTANISIDYYIEYKMEDQNHKEKGKEFWTIIKQNNAWKLVWRAMVGNENL